LSRPDVGPSRILLRTNARIPGVKGIKRWYGGGDKPRQPLGPSGFLPRDGTVDGGGVLPSLQQEPSAGPVAAGGEHDAAMSTVILSAPQQTGKHNREESGTTPQVPCIVTASSP
jgi:hypothetical protein